MFERVIVAIDGHPGGRDAAALAEALAGDAEIVFAHVYGDARGERAARELVRREAGLSIADARVEVARGDTPGQGLAHLAERLPADLLVVGSSHRGPVGRVLLGDAGRDVLVRAPCAIAVAPRDVRIEPSPLRAIGVGYDGTPESERAMTVAAEIARTTGARLRALGVVEPAEGSSHARRDAIARRLDHAKMRLAPETEGHVVVSDTRAELDRFSQEVDLLCVGEREHGAFAHLRHGSVSQHLAHHAACGLLVVPWRVRLAQAPTAVGGASGGAVSGRT
jgi:nucleotide-binding universal stress UspA family protein